MDLCVGSCEGVDDAESCKLELCVVGELDEGLHLLDADHVVIK